MDKIPLGKSVATLAAVVATTLCGANSAEAAASGIYGGGPLYINAKNNINELRNAGFQEVIVWNIGVNSSGDLNFNGEFMVCSGGSYVGGNTHPDFTGNMAILKQGAVKRVTFCVGSANYGVFQNIRDLINSQGTGPGSILYRNFWALKNAIPALDAIDFDDENCYDTSTMVQFAVMLGNLGFKVSLCPYTDGSFWENVCSQVNSQRPGTIDAVHLQCYSGGGNNSPCSWYFGGVPVYPGVWDGQDSAASAQAKMGSWQNSCGITGGWVWIYDDLVGRSASYAAAINNALGSEWPANGTYKLINNLSGLALDASGGGTGNGTPLIQWGCNGGANQLWNLYNLGGGQYALLGYGSGRSINVAWGATGNNATIILYDWLDQDDEIFTFRDNGMGYYSLIFVGSGRALTVYDASTASGAGIIQFDYNTGQNAQWQFQAP